MPTFVYLLIAHSVWSAIAYCLVGVVAIVLIMTGTLAFYLLLLQSIPSHRVKKIVGYFQIFATLIFFTAYQLPSLLGDVRSIAGIILVDRPYGFAFPGLWLGGLFKTITSLSVGPLGYAQAALALGAAGAGSWYYLRQSRGYADRLLSLKLSSGAAPAATSGTKPVARRAPVREWLASWLTANNQERVSFRFHWNMMLRDMTFKQRVFPALVYLPVVMVATVFRDVFRKGETVDFGDNVVLLLFYFVMWIVVIPLGQTKVSDDYRSSWIFEATANPYPQRIEFGKLMAVIGMFFLPTALIYYPAALWFFGWAYWSDLLLAIGNTLLFSMIYSGLDTGHPFSRSKEDSKYQNLLPLFMVGIVGSALGFGHYYLRALPYAIPVATVGVWAILFYWFYWMRRVTRTELAGGRG